MKFFQRTVLLAAGALSLGAGICRAGGLDLDGGLRASIYDDNYKLGLGLSLGAVRGVSANSDLGLHLNYSRFDNKTESFTPANEFGGYVAWYYLPQLDQPFTMRIGPHAGASKIRTWYADLGADVVVIVPVTPVLRVYGSLIPSYFIGENPQTLTRVGLGMQYKVGG